MISCTWSCLVPVFSPASSVQYLKGQPSKGLAASLANVKQLIAELDADKFATRKNAAEDLSGWGGWASPPCARHSRRPELEARRAIEALLKSDQVRRAVDDSGMTRYRICKDLGIAESTMSRFMAGKGGLSLHVLDALADLLNLNITTAKRRKTRKED